MPLSRALQNSEEWLELDKPTKFAQYDGDKYAVLRRGQSLFPTIWGEPAARMRTRTTNHPSTLPSHVEKSSRNDTGNPPPEFCNALLPESFALFKGSWMRKNRIDNRLIWWHDRGA